MAKFNGSDTCYMGKWKGRDATWSHILNHDASWLAWLRDQRGRIDFSDDLNTGLDAAINGDRYLKRKYGHTTNPSWDKHAAGVAAAGTAIKDAAKVRETHAAQRMEAQAAYAGDWGGW